MDNIHRLPSLNFLSLKSFIFSRDVLFVAKYDYMKMKDLQGKRFKELRRQILSNKRYLKSDIIHCYNVKYNLNVLLSVASKQINQVIEDNSYYIILYS